MSQHDIEESFIQTIRRSIVEGKPISQFDAKQRGLDIDFLEITAQKSCKVLEGSEIFVLLGDLPKNHDELTGNHWHRFIKAAGLLDVRGVRFGGERKALIQRHPQWAPTLRLERFTGIRVDDISPVEVFLTADSKWIVYRGAMKDNPDTGFLRQFGTVREMCGYLDALALGEYRFETPSVAIALADQLMAFVSDHHQLLRQRRRSAAELLDEQRLVRKHFENWTPTFQ